MRDWGLLYQRQPLQTDAVFLALALFLHVPLLTLHMTASHRGPKTVKEGRLHDIDFIEKQTEKRKEKAAGLPKAPDAVKMQEKAAEIRARLLKKAVPLPPVVPKADIKQDLATIDPSKIKMDAKRQLELQSQKLLDSKKNFLDKAMMPGAAAAKEIKMGGGVSAIQMGAKPGALPGGPGGLPAVKGRSGFTVSEKSMPTSIGGGDEGLKMGGGPAIVVPTGMRGKADAGVLSSVAMVKDRGSLQGKGGGLGGPGPAGGGGPSGLALGPGGAGGAIAVSGAARGPAAAMPAMPAVSSGRSFSEKSVSASAAPAGEGGLRGAGAGLPEVSAIARRARTARPMFQITGPLEKRPVVSRVIPEYPDWARSKGIEASVTLQFTVTPDGFVKDTIIVLRTTGYPSLDETTKEALRQWRFAPLPPDQMRDEVGAITMNFSVR